MPAFVAMPKIRQIAQPQNVKPHERVAEYGELPALHLSDR